MSNKQWYLVKLQEEYDRSLIVFDEFITQEPEKYKKEPFVRIKEIKVK